MNAPTLAVPGLPVVSSSLQQPSLIVNQECSLICLLTVLTSRWWQECDDRTRDILRVAIYHLLLSTFTHSDSPIADESSNVNKLEPARVPYRRLCAVVGSIEDVESAIEKLVDMGVIELAYPKRSPVEFQFTAESTALGFACVGLETAEMRDRQAHLTPEDFANQMSSTEEYFLHSLYQLNVECDGAQVDVSGLPLLKQLQALSAGVAFISGMVWATRDAETRCVKTPLMYAPVELRRQLRFYGEPLSSVTVRDLDLMLVALLSVAHRPGKADTMEFIRLIQDGNLCRVIGKAIGEPEDTARESLQRYVWASIPDDVVGSVRLVKKAIEDRFPSIAITMNYLKLESGDFQREMSKLRRHLLVEGAASVVIDKQQALGFCAAIDSGIVVTSPAVEIARRELVSVFAAKGVRPVITVENWADPTGN